MQEIDTLIEILERIQREQMHPQPKLSEEQYEMLREAHQRQKERLIESQMQPDLTEDELQTNQLQIIEAADAAKRGGCKFINRQRAFRSFCYQALTTKTLQLLCYFFCI